MVQSLLKATVFAMLAISLLIQPSLARPEYMKEFKEYPDEIKRCTLCHVQSSGYGGLNPFGRDFAAEGGLTEKLLEMDSDGDGYSNGAELSSGSLPGNPERVDGKEAPGFVLILSAVVLVTVAFVRRS
ncbi:hypothetical protein GAH_01091 [Geoglobus ahangari]|uniref:Temptin Cys/Cys disulfide domain-containing protein n=1 Tax=Geoglobus ahangari TaxID=113653 RepID=A0A0F7DBS3_9EURY|nr:thrombospondin type 3 repeat-containing protein [Geoglobus ahangari]AKG91591.1 hypothetical protein GAH_01091 [Geoglobus ahangari]